MTESSSATGNIIAEDSDQSQEVETHLKQRCVISRVETNLERLPIWSPKPKRGTVFTPCKIIELEPEQLPDGQLIQRKVKIVPSALYGYPTTQTQEYWYAFQKLWHDSLTKETGRIEFSRRQVIEDVLGKTYGRDTRKALDLSINQLGSTRFEFDYVFYEKESDTTHRELRKFHLIVDEHLTTRKRGNEIIHEKCFVTLHPLIVSNLRCGYFKPILLSVVSQLKSDVARLLYRKLDSQFSYYTKYEISTERFFREHCLVGGEYHQSGRRKRLLEKAIQELIGKPTSSGAVIVKYEFARTTDAKDWKLIVRASKGKRLRKTVEAEVVKASGASTHQQKSSQKQQKPRQKPEKTQARETPASTPKKPLEAKSEALEVLDYFDKVFGLGGDDDKQHSKNVVTKAEAFIKRDGLEKTKFLIDFARREASKTDYEPRTFNGITQYRSDALKAWKANVRLRERQEREAQKMAQRLRENARLDHEKIYRDDYYEYVNELVFSLGNEHPSRFNEFRVWQAEQRREKENLEGNLREVSLRVFDSEGQSILRLTQFFQDDPDIHIPDFWQWDCQENPHRFTTEGEGGTFPKKNICEKVTEAHRRDQSWL